MATVSFVKSLAGLSYMSDEDRDRMKNIGRIGTVIVGEFRAPRSGAFHRKCVVLQKTIFDNQERFNDYPSFREWLKLKTGLFEWKTDPAGNTYPKTKSTAYESMDEVAHSEWYQKLINFAIQEGCLFEGKTAQEADAFVDQILGGFA